LASQPGARSLSAPGKHFEILVVGDAQINQPHRAVVLVEPHHLGKAELVDVIVERPVEVLDLDRDVADAGNTLDHFSSRALAP
jgi:hypothetical protein